MENALHYIDRDFDEVNWIVWGNKCDLSMPEVGIKEARSSLSSKYDTQRIKFNIVSAKTGKNVESLFSELVESTHNKAKIQTVEKDTRNTVDLDELQPNGKKKCC